MYGPLHVRSPDPKQAFIKEQTVNLRGGIPCYDFIDIDIT